MDNLVHRTCLYLVYEDRIQHALDRSKDAWNHHEIRTAHYRTPIAQFEISREKAINQGYWTGDAGDSIDEASQSFYGVDSDAPIPPADEMAGEPSAPRMEPLDPADQAAQGISVHTDEELEDARMLLHGFDYHRDDKNWGLDVYCQAVELMFANLAARAGNATGQ
jgi:hypothetical protein